MISALDISTSGLIAQRARLNAVSSNIANLSTNLDENGNIQPFQARFVVFQPDAQRATADGAVGVRVSSVETRQVEPNYRFDPDHPLAVQQGKWKGYVAYPDISLNEEMVNALEATRAYEANIGVIETTKSMGRQTLRILA